MTMPWPKISLESYIFWHKPATFDEARDMIDLYPLLISISVSSIKRDSAAENLILPYQKAFLYCPYNQDQFKIYTTDSR